MVIMLIVYDRKTEQIIAHCSRVFDSGKWREATIDEILPKHDRTNLAAAYFHDEANYIANGILNLRLRKDENGLVTGIECLPLIELSVDAKDTDNDGIPDIPADGSSITRITAATADRSDTEITFRVSRGSLSDRKVRTSKGKATVQLQSATETVTSTIIATSPGYRNGTLHIEFIPFSRETASRNKK
jgi:hypothetical protein